MSNAVKEALDPQIREIAGKTMVNSDWCIKEFGIASRSTLSIRMKHWNVAGIRVFGQKYYPLARIQAAIDKPLRRDRA